MVEPVPAPLDLTGTWRAMPADEDLRRHFAERDLDDDGWEPIGVPGHWRSTPAFSELDGPLFHRRRFEAAPPPAGSRSWLVLDGLFYQGDVWLDGCYQGDTEGYFVRHSFEVSELLRAGGEHLLAIEVTCAPQTDRTAKRNLTGVFQHWDCLDPDWNPGGIWRPVRLEHTGPVRARGLRVLCREASPDRAVLALRAELDTDVARHVTLRTRVAGGPSGREREVLEQADDRPLAEGSNFVDWTVTVPRPDLWWPRALGAQPLHDVEVAVEVDGEVSHTVTRRTGFRTVAMKRWVASVNGERLFLKGSNTGPTKMQLAEATPEDLRGDVDLAVEAGLDLLRIHAHITRPELYEAADEAGLLLWQDLPLQWGYARGTRKQAVRQAGAAVDLLGHHPSVAIWCGHNEPFALDIEPGTELTPKELRKLVVTFVGAQQLPGWNKTVLDRSLKRALEKADPTRPVIPHSGVLPHLGSGGTDTHVYFGWYHGDERDFPGFCHAVPRLARFVTEFGAQAVPETDGFLEPERWPDLDWARLGRTHALQKPIFDARVPPGDHASFDSWRKATQDHQASVLTSHIETLRRLKYRPTGGFATFSFADGHPSVTWSVLDHERVPKAGWTALVEACRPVIVVADRLPATVAPGDRLALDVHVVSDLRVPLEDLRTTARLCWPGGEAVRRFVGGVPADAVARVGTLSLVVPDAPGELSLELELTGPAGLTAGNRYAATIGRTVGGDGIIGT